MNTLEATKASYTQKASEVRIAIANASKKRPTADMVQACWGRATEAWPRLNDKQRSTVLSAVIKHVSVTSKSSVVATLATSPHFTDRMLAPNSIMGAGNSADANLALAGQNLYSDVVLNVPLIRPKRALITDLRAVWSDVGAASPGSKGEEESS